MQERNGEQQCWVCCVQVVRGATANITGCKCSFREVVKQHICTRRDLLLDFLQLGELAFNAATVRTHKLLWHASLIFVRSSSCHWNVCMELQRVKHHNFLATIVLVTPLWLQEICTHLEFGMGLSEELRVS